MIVFESIQIEGHTDNVDVSEENPIKDNLELSRLSNKFYQQETYVTFLCHSGKRVLVRKVLMYQNLFGRRPRLNK